MASNFRTEAMELMVRPSDDDIRAKFAPYVAARILRHLHPVTGDVNRGEFQCVRIDSIVFNPYSIRVFYITLRPDGKTGSQFADFSHHRFMMRCLPVTLDGQVIMIQEHRRQRGEWVLMLPAGGDKHELDVEVVIDELLAETGCRLTEGSRITEVANRFADDGAHAERLLYVTVDQLVAPKEHQNPREGIRGIVTMPFDEWRQKALAGEFDDPFCEFFVARCSYLPTPRRVIVGGNYRVLKR